MTPEHLRNEITEYLNEQEIAFRDDDPLKLLCLRAGAEGYSFSDEMYEYETAMYIPSEKEIEWFKNRPK